MGIRMLLLIGLLFYATCALTQEACPGGTQVGQDCRGGYCVPICAYDESQQTAQPPPPRVVERWEVIDDRFGAIALASNGIYATSSDRRSKEDAEATALGLCAERGGEDCKLKGGGANQNSCGTLAWGGGISFIDGNVTPELSERDALEGCRRNSGENCRVIETYCSLPVSRWVYEKPENWAPNPD